MSGPLTVIPPRQSLVDNTGHITRVWWLFFQEVFERIGGTDAPTNLELAGMALNPAFVADPVAADAMRAVDELRNEIASVRSQLGEALSLIETLTAQLAGLRQPTFPEAQAVIEELLRRPIDTALESRVTQLEDRLA